MDTVSDAQRGVLPDAQRAAALQQVQDHLGRVREQAARLRRTNTRLIFTSLTASTLATLLAGLTAAMGPLAGQGPPAWRLTCGVVAVLTALAGLLSGLQQQLGVADRLARATACVGRLGALEVALLLTRRDTAEITRELEEIHAGYHDVLLG